MMRSFPGITVCLLLILVSCSPYQKVSYTNFKELGIPDDERESLHYVLKKRELHYSVALEENNFNQYDRETRTLTNSHKNLVENNIVIPKGAQGVCVDSFSDYLLIDFGEGVVVPFRIFGNDNSPGTSIKVDDRTFQLVINTKAGRLYFLSSK